MKECRTEGCQFSVLSRGYCSKCYWSLKSKGVFGGDKCNVDGCTRIVYGIKLCSKHYIRFKKYGDASCIKIVRGENRSSNYLYNTYCGIKYRCYNQSSPAYLLYGGRGITLCDRRLGLDGFTNFCNDMGERPEGCSLDRVNVNGNYEPSNCRRATRSQQNNNTRKTIMYNGEPASVAQKRLGLGRGIISGRIKRGWSLHDAFTVPYMPNDKTRKQCVAL